MNNEINTNLLVNSFKYLKAYNLSPISVQNLQEIIHHGLENFNDIKDTKLKFVIENPENKKQRKILSITKICYVAELKMLSFQNNQKTKNIMSLFDLQFIINELKSNFSEWSTIIINIENIMTPTDYFFTDSNEIFFKIRNMSDENND